MKLIDIVSSYTGLKQSSGMSFRNEVGILKAFCRKVGDVDINDVTTSNVSTFIAGQGSVTAFFR